MEKLRFTISINAPILSVYDSMLGLSDKKSYENWVSIFSPTSTYEGSWEKGSKIYFTAVDASGKKGGMVSEIAENISPKFISIEHKGFLVDGKEILSGEEIDKWAGCHENYSFTENNGATDVVVEMDSINEYVDYFQKHYPQALQKLKDFCESQ